MKTNEGYIALYRKLENHWIWNDPYYLRAWIKMLFQARYSDGKSLYRGKVLHLRRGEFVASESEMVEWFGFKSRNRLRHFLYLLESDGMIRQESWHGLGTRLSICNYSSWQPDPNNLWDNLRTGHEQVEFDKNLTPSKNGDNFGDNSGDNLGDRLENKLNNDESEGYENQGTGNDTTHEQAMAQPSDRPRTGHEQPMVQQCSNKGEEGNNYKKSNNSTDNSNRVRVPDKIVESIYKEYPRKEGKEKAKDKIKTKVRKIAKERYEGDVKEAGRFMVRAVRRFRALDQTQQKLENGEKNFIPMPATWFNQGRYDDEILWESDEVSENQSMQTAEQAREAGYLPYDEANRLAQERYYTTLDKAKALFLEVTVEGTTMYKPTEAE